VIWMRWASHSKAIATVFSSICRSQPQPRPRRRYATNASSFSRRGCGVE
jgi:hypothetical protein